MECEPSGNHLLGSSFAVAYISIFFCLHLIKNSYIYKSRTYSIIFRCLVSFYFQFSYKVCNTFNKYIHSNVTFELTITFCLSFLQSKFLLSEKRYNIKIKSVSPNNYTI